MFLRSQVPTRGDELRIIGCLVALMVSLLLGGCANSPIRVWDMGASALQQIPDQALCNAIAQGIASRRPAPLLEPERQRRAISCQTELDERVSNCGKLVVVDPDPYASTQMSADGQGYQHMAQVRIRNTDTVPRNFRIGWRGSLSPLLRIEASSEQSYGVVASVRSPVGSNGELRSTRAFLQECVVVPGHAPREIAW